MSSVVRRVLAVVAGAVVAVAVVSLSDALIGRAYPLPPGTDIRWMWPAAFVLVPLVGWLGARAGSVGSRAAT